jgi:hypothetical protein
MGGCTGFKIRFALPRPCTHCTGAGTHATETFVATALVEDNAVLVEVNAVLVRSKNGFAGRQIKSLLNLRCGDKRSLVK